MPKSVIAAQLYTVRNFCQTLPDISKTLQKLVAIGYEAVQISGIGPVDSDELSKVISDNGLVVAATHFGWDSFLDDLDKVIEKNKKWGCVHVAVGALPPEYRNIEGLDRFLKEFKPIAEKLLSAGIDFSYHNHSFEFIHYDGKMWLESLYERSDPKLLKAELDTYWVQHGGASPADWIRKCAGREPLLHLKDMVLVPPCEQRFAEIGEGNLNWSDILNVAQNSQVEWFIVEQDDCYGRDPFESLEISLQNLKIMGIK